MRDPSRLTYDELLAAEKALHEKALGAPREMGGGGTAAYARFAFEWDVYARECDRRGLKRTSQGITGGSMTDIADISVNDYVETTCGIRARVLADFLCLDSRRQLALEVPETGALHFADPSNVRLIPPNAETIAALRESEASP